MSSNQTWEISSRTSAQGWSSLLAKGATLPVPPMVRIPFRRVQVSADCPMVPEASGSTSAATEAASRPVPPQVQAGGASVSSPSSAQQGMVQVPASQQSPMPVSSPAPLSAAKALTDNAITRARIRASVLRMFLMLRLLTPPP